MYDTYIPDARFKVVREWRAAITIIRDLGYLGTWLKGHMQDHVSVLVLRTPCLYDWSKGDDDNIKDLEFR